MIRQLRSSVVTFESEGWKVSGLLRELADWLDEDEERHLTTIALAYDDWDGEGVCTTLTAVFDHPTLAASNTDRGSNDG